MKHRFPTLFLSCLFIPVFVHAQIIVDHTCTDIHQIPDAWINAAKANLRIGYGHTSHGSQLVTGIQAFRGNPGDLYYFTMSDWGLSTGKFLNDYWGNAGGASDLGHNGDLAWRDATVSMLNLDDNDRNVVMWSWCGGCSDNDTVGINAYLNAMAQLELDYPDVTFIYMTGHLDGTGEAGTLNTCNNQIRDYCVSHDKILFDFADIESYDPSGSCFLPLYADDNCDYQSNGEHNWAQEWIAAHPEDELTQLAAGCGECAHSQHLNCILKGRAFWWLMARIAGWDPAAAGSPTPEITETPTPDIPPTNTPIPSLTPAETATPSGTPSATPSGTPTPSSGTVLHVPGEYSTIQTAINAAQNGDTVLVADGTYTGSGNRDIEFYGRAITLISENGPEYCVIDCEHIIRAFNFWSQETHQTSVSGFTVQNGNAGESEGGAFYCEYDANPMISHCIMTGNTGSRGGAVYSIGTSLILFDCTITGNTASGDNMGGGIFISDNSPIIVDRCVISNNTASGTNGQGGGLYCGGEANISNCIISGNSALEGGGIYVDYEAQPTLTNDLFVNNVADWGGAVYCVVASPALRNCTFTRNTGSGEESKGGGAVFFIDSTPEITNCIAWNNSPDELTGTGTPVVTYSDIFQESGVYPGTGNINADPLFVTGQNGDYYLSQTQSGQSANSPCLDSGSAPASDICMTTASGTSCLDERTTRTDKMSDLGTVDLGYHYAAPPCIHSGDVDASGHVTSGDAQSAFLVALGFPEPSADRCAADCNKDGSVTSGDAQGIFNTALGAGQCSDPL